MNNNEIVRISSEWLDANKSRAYPFDESCAESPNRVPSPVFTDAFFRTSGLAGSVMYVSRVVQGQTSFQVYAATKERELGLLADIPYTTPERAQIPVEISFEDGAYVSGTLVVGDVSEIRRMGAETALTDLDGKFFYGCVREIVDNRVRGIRIGDSVYTGIVNLVPGAGIELSVEESEEGTTILISATDRELPDENKVIISDATLAAEINAMYGSPILKINGVEPDDSGNITLAYPDPSYESGYRPFPGDENKSTITLDDASGASESCTNPLIETIMANIAELNNRSARCIEMLNAIDTANNVMSISLSRLS